MKEKIYDIKSINKMRCIAGLIMSSIMVCLVFLVVVLSSANYYKEEGSEVGLGTFRMFTTISNILVGVGALLTIPFQIDGLSKNNYHLPRWIIDIIYIGVTGVALTFVFASTGISFAIGFKEAMLSKGNLFFHFINPVMAITLFTFINCDHNIKFYKSLLTLIPIVIYGIIYFILVIAIGEEKGGWRDVYQFNTVIPWYVTLIFVLSLAFGISNLLRYLHNIKHRNFKNSLIRYYMKSPIYEKESIEEAIKTFAYNEVLDYRGGDINIPTRILNNFKERYNSNKSINELSYIYINYFLNLLEQK